MANNNDNRNKLLSALITLLLGAGIVALLIFTSLHYNYLTSRVNKIMNRLEGSTMEFMDLLNEPAKSAEQTVKSTQQPPQFGNR